MKFFDFENDMKMADQIEMSTAENSTGNPFGPVTNYLGKQPNVRNTFSFNTSQVPKSPNSSWIPFNMSISKLHQCVATFEERWPKQISQRPYQMIASGFYYTGCGDKVTCFHCGITFHNWESLDDVDGEHKKHSPECKYLFMCREV